MTRARIKHLIRQKYRAIYRTQQHGENTAALEREIAALWAEIKTAIYAEERKYGNT
jgi:hypothetical protein